MLLERVFRDSPEPLRWAERIVDPWDCEFVDTVEVGTIYLLSDCRSVHLYAQLEP